MLFTYDLQLLGNILLQHLIKDEVWIALIEPDNVETSVKSPEIVEIGEGGVLDKALIDISLEEEVIFNV